MLRPLFASLSSSRITCRSSPIVVFMFYIYSLLCFNRHIDQHVHLVNVQRRPVFVAQCIQYHAFALTTRQLAQVIDKLFLILFFWPRRVVPTTQTSQVCLQLLCQNVTHSGFFSSSVRRIGYHVSSFFPHFVHTSSRQSSAAHQPTVKRMHFGSCSFPTFPLHQRFVSLLLLRGVCLSSSNILSSVVRIVVYFTIITGCTTRARFWTSRFFVLGFLFSKRVSEADGDSA